MERWIPTCYVAGRPAGENTDGGWEDTTPLPGSLLASRYRRAQSEKRFIQSRYYWRQYMTFLAVRNALETAMGRS